MTSKITKSDQNKIIARSCGCSFSWGYERQGNLAYAYSMIPALRKLYGGDRQKMAEALKRHLEYFNITNQCMTFCLGLSVAMEEELAENPDFDETSINKTKVAMMGPLSGIGDAFFWGTFKIIATAVGTALALQGSLLGPILFFLIYNIPAFAVRIGLMKAGYQMGTRFLSNVEHSGMMSVIIKGATILGLFVVGGMCASVVNLNLAWQITDGANSMTLSEMLNGIMPCLTSLMVFAITYYGLIVKKMKSTTMILLMTVISIVGAYFGILA